jgi:ethanolamine utilization protein EutQ (cupin superfamily)
MVWECSAGVFRWYYSFDETLHVLEGSALIDDGNSPPRTIGPGDVVFFPAGATAVWRVDNHIRKVAFCRKALPAPIGAVLRTLRSAKKALRAAQPAVIGAS